MINILASILFWFVTIVYVPIVLIPIILLSYIYPPLLHPIKIWWGRLGIMALFIKPKIIGIENIPNKPVIFASNHTSMLDIQLLVGYLPKNFQYLIKQELFKIPVFGTTIRKLGSYPINRKSPKKAFETTQKIIEDMKKQQTSITIFPEGTRNPNGGLLPFKKGLLKISYEAQIPIIPITVNGCSKTFNGKNIIAHRTPLSIIIGKEIDPPKTKEEIEIIKEKLWQAIYKNLEENQTN